MRESAGWGTLLWWTCRQHAIRRLCHPLTVRLHPSKHGGVVGRPGWQHRCRRYRAISKATAAVVMMMMSH